MLNRRKTHRQFVKKAAVLLQAVIFGGTVGVGVAALAVDVGLLCAARSQIQRTADASALAGASGLLQQQTVERAEQFAYYNEVAHQALLSSDLVITTGNWDGVDRSFTPTPEEGVGGVLPNAVHVVGTRSNLGLFFARALGLDTTVVRRPATALVGSGRCAGIWGLEGVTTNGGIITDSYDPAVGPYGPGNIRPNGDICSCKDITVHGSSSIRGDAMYGEGYEFDPSGGSYEVLGLIDDQVCKPMPDLSVDFEAAEADNDNELIEVSGHGPNPFHGPGNLVLAGHRHVTLPGGTFYFNSVRIEGQAFIEVTGPTKLYINGDAILTGGGLVNTTGLAENLYVYVEGPDVVLSGDSQFIGALIAPTASITVQGDFTGYGTVLAGGELTINGDVEFYVNEGMVFELFGLKSIAPILVE